MSVRTGAAGATLRRLLRRSRRPHRPAAGPGRAFETYEDDVMVVSYPRSGNTWMRFLLGNVLVPEPATDFENVDRRVAPIYSTPADVLAAAPRPRYLKSHEALDPRYRTVIYLVRDPRDVAASYYRWHLKRGTFDEREPMDRFVDRFIAGLHPTEDLPIAYGSWHDNVASWIGGAEAARILLVRYEDLRSDTAHELGRVVVFLGLPVGSQAVEAAVEASALARMRDLEVAQRDSSRLFEGTRSDVPFVGAGGAGTWAEALPPASAEAIVAAWGDLMRRLRYDT